MAAVAVAVAGWWARGTQRTELGIWGSSPILIGASAWGTGSETLHFPGCSLECFEGVIVGSKLRREIEFCS